MDAGNSLFKNPGGASSDEKERAAFILSTLKAQGLAAMAVGHRDLSAGPEWLIRVGGKLPLLSANLQLNGKRPFAASTVVKVAGARVAIIGLTQPGSVPGVEGLVGLAIEPTLKDAIKGLPAHDLTVVLAAVPMEEVIRFGPALQGVDFIVQSGDQRGQVPPQKFDSGAVMLGAGVRGQALGLLELHLGGKGPFADAQEGARQKEQLEHLNSQLKSLEERGAKVTDAEAKAQLAKTLKDMRARRDEQAKAVSSATQAARRFDFRWVPMDSSVPDDEKIKAQILKFEPTGTSSH